MKSGRDSGYLIRGGQQFHKRMKINHYFLLSTKLPIIDPSTTIYSTRLKILNMNKLPVSKILC